MTTSSLGSTCNGLILNCGVALSPASGIKILNRPLQVDTPPTVATLTSVSGVPAVSSAPQATTSQSVGKPPTGTSLELTEVAAPEIKLSATGCPTLKFST